MQREKGLTLIELAIVLIILGILLGIGAGIIGVLIKRVKYNESREIVNAAVEGIIGYATSSGRLPTNTELSSAVRTLKDSYGKDLAYVYDQNLTTSSPYGFCGLNSTNITVKVCPDTACSSPTQTINNVAFIIISGDGNYNNQTAGTQGVNSATTVKVYEYGVNVDNYTGDINRTEPYDDIVKWVSLNELQTAQGCESLTVTSPTTLPVAIEDSAYTYTLRAKGGRPPYTWSGTVGGGLSLASDGTISGTVNTNTSTTTGEVSGCSTQINFTATVTDSAGQSVSQSFTIPVNAKPVEIVTNTLPDAYEGTAYSANIYAVGGDGNYTFSGNGLPTWLTLNTSTGALSGTPPTDSGCSEGVENFSVTASSCSNTYTKGFSITVRDPDCGGGGGGGGCPTLVLSPSSGTYPATVGNPFSASATLSGGQPPVNILSCSPPSCNGLSFTCTTSGVTISGTPTAPGTCTFSATYQDSCSPTPQTVTGNYTVNITGCPTLSGIAGAFSTATNCQPYSASASAIGGQSPYTWTLVSGSLPRGLNFCSSSSSATCTISGTPSDNRGNYSFTIRVQDSCGQAVSQGFTLTLQDNCKEIKVRNNMVIRGPGPIRFIDLYYRINGGGCKRWRAGRDIKVKPRDIVDIYYDPACRPTKKMCTVHYCDLKNYDANNNCKIQIYDTNRILDCEFADR